MLRLLNIKEFFVEQNFIANYSDQPANSSLVNIRKKQLQLKELIKQDNEITNDNQHGGSGTIKGLRAKDDLNRRSPLSTRMTRKR